VNIIGKWNPGYAYEGKQNGEPIDGLTIEYSDHVTVAQNNNVKLVYEGTLFH